jgi:hypothetical protein
MGPGRVNLRVNGGFLAHPPLTRLLAEHFFLGQDLCQGNPA